VTPADASALLTMVGREEMARLVAPLAPTIDGVETFVAHVQRQRQSGRAGCFAVTPIGCSQPIGVIHLKQLDAETGCAEWQFAISPQFWGTGVFPEAANLAIEFAFDHAGAHRLEARAAVLNGRGNGALRKLGAAQEGVLRKSLSYRGEFVDQILWAIVDEDWRAYRGVTLEQSQQVH
jgi:RimJ/RimL family protein N-acetyltransferase